MNKPIITRNDMFRDFCNRNSGVSMSLLIVAFRGMTDQDLADETGLTVLRKGYFYQSNK